jgi:hypothetical protein
MDGISGGGGADVLKGVIIRNPGLIRAAETMLRVEDAVLDMDEGITVVAS